MIKRDVGLRQCPGIWVVCMVLMGWVSSVSAAPITSLFITGGEFRMGPFTQNGPVPYSSVDLSLDLIATFPTTIGWDVNVKHESAQPGTVVAFPFGTPFVNTFIVECDPQQVDNCVANPHTPVTGTVAGGSAVIADGDPIVVDMNGLYANWNGIDFNQGGTTGDGVAYPGEAYEYNYTSTVSNVSGNTFEYNMTYQSLIVGGPFNGQVGTWTYTGHGTVALVGNPPQTDPGLTLSPNNFSQIAGLTTGDIAAAGYPLPGADQDCIGGCWDYMVTGLAAPGDTANVVIPLGSGIPGTGTSEQAIELWKLDTNTVIWRPFDASTGDAISTAPLVGPTCPPPADAAYTAGLTTGDACLQITIADGGPNDDDGLANQVILDPGSLVLTSSAPGITNINDNGCSLGAEGVSKGAFEKIDWLLLLGLVAWFKYRSTRSEASRVLP